jgi:hypothetical protein
MVESPNFATEVCTLSMNPLRLYRTSADQESNCGGTQASKRNDSPGFKSRGMESGNDRPSAEKAVFQEPGMPLVAWMPV